jgi:integrase
MKLNKGDEQFGSVYQADGSWYFRCRSFVDIKDSGRQLESRKQQAVRIGERVDSSLWKSEKSTEVQKAANAIRAKIVMWEKAALAGEEPTAAPNMRVTDFVEQVFLPWIQKHRSASTFKSYSVYWKTYLLPHFNHTRTLRDYESRHGNRLIETLCSKYSENTVMHARALCSAIFALAKTHGYLPNGSSNPWRDIKRTVAAQPVKETIAYTQKEVELIMDALNNIEGREEYSAKVAGMMIAICFYGGLRPSEAAGLKWEDVDFDKNRMLIRAAFVAGSFKETTKTKKSRYVSFFPQLRDRLQLWAMDARRGQDVELTGWVFPNQSDSNPINVNDLGARVIKTTCKKFGLKWHGLYACRRGFGTLLYLAGCTLAEVADAMGNSPEVVFENYFKDKESTLGAQAVAKTAAAMSGRQNNRILEAAAPLHELPEFEGAR